MPYPTLSDDFTDVYLVRWVGWPDAFATIEPTKNIDDRAVIDNDWFVRDVRSGSSSGVLSLDV